MASLRIIRRRLRSTQSTKQVMRAMQLVSGSKFKRAQMRLVQGRQMLQFLDALLQRVLAATEESAERAERVEKRRRLDHPLSARHEGKPGALLIVTSDAGLAGSYNANLIQLAEAELRKETARTTQLAFLGKRGHRYFTKRGYQARDAFLDFASRPDISKIDALGTILMNRFLAGEISSVRLLYAQFKSATVSRPMVKQWLPVSLDQLAAAVPATPQARKGERRALPLEYIFEPSAARVFEDLLPRWAIATFRLSLLEAFTSEHGARMIAMKNATDNAQELITSLTRERNKIRQASITRELSEIVGTVEALK